ncbi:MAG: Efflux ABC transporter, ATP-binding protein [uncultured Thermomicrobiales bacterium]|uniref:Efflux ABC transporter, ATP-binding protein n=1 Tax=uncultured Thermomicrobiales bacterium TaxID=1645740 RepID=A0A6J4VXA2_9BACT|nr:MAG: Efflux ABC transporter, ATP-binding protein [uncultured Thermomicrobiales bacterium]
MTATIGGARTMAGAARHDAGAASDLVLRVTGLTKRYGARTVVDGLDLEVRRGEVFGFLGPNGAGKTTAMAMILGLVAPHAGQIEILGHDALADREAALRRVGAIVETPTYYPYLSGLDNLRVLALARGGAPQGRLDEVLRLVGLKGRERDRFGSYSLGMKQRLGIAGALLHEPELLILDEPSNGLDPAGMVEIRELILRLAHDGRTIVLCSHLLAEVQQVCDRVLILAGGRAIVQSEVATLLSQGAQTVLRVDDPTRAAGILRGVAWIEEVAREGDALLLTMPPDRQFALGQVLSEHGLIVGEMRREERDLESYFLSITGDAPAPL